ncbi:MAG: hypothetical protein HY606_03590 [Planctomycetes bacterium]|nr:hypothetical protein [Planctomycetota bacterium]
MREFKGDWKDVFKLFPVFFDPRKLILALTGLLATVLIIGLVTFWVAQAYSVPENINQITVGTYQGKPIFAFPKTLAPDEIWSTFCVYKTFILKNAPFYAKTLYIFVIVLLFFMIWSYFGGAICRSAAYEIAKDGERLELTKIKKFAVKRFWSFFMPPVICLLGFTFFYICNMVGALVFKTIDVLATVASIGSVGTFLGSLLFILCLLAGFIMALICLGTIFGLPLFKPAIAVEGTEAFDAVSRGFAYVFSKPFHFIWYQVIAFIFGWICFAFIFIVAILLLKFGSVAVSSGYSLVWKSKGDFKVLNNFAWQHVLSEKFKDNCCLTDVNCSLMTTIKHPYPKLMHFANKIANPVYDRKAPNGRLMKFSGYVVLFWFILTLGFVYSSVLSYYFTAQTLIYLLLRKKVDDIDINEVYPEDEEHEFIEGQSDQPKQEPQK